MPPKAVNIKLYANKRFPTSVLRQLAGITDHDCSIMATDDSSLAKDSKGVPVMGVMKYLTKKWKELRNIQKKSKDTEKEDVTIDLKIKEQKLLKEIILNQTKAGLMIPREIAKKRIEDTLRGVANSIRNSLKTASKQMVKKWDVIDGDPRKIEEIFTDSYNKALQKLHDESDNVSWADDDNDIEVLKKRLFNVAEDDPVYADTVEELYGIEDK